MAQILSKAEAKKVREVFDFVGANNDTDLEGVLYSNIYNYVKRGGVLDTDMIFRYHDTFMGSDDE